MKSYADNNKNEIASKPSFTLGEELDDESEMKPAVFCFEKGIVGTEYLYAGSYFCWRAPNDTSFSAIDVDRAVIDAAVHELEKERMGSRLAIDEEHFPISKKVEFTKFVGKTEPHMIGISEQQPYVLSRMIHANSLNDNKIRKLANRIQVTMDSRALVYDLNEDIPVPVDESSAMHQLADPQNFVDTAVSQQTFEEKRSVPWVVENLEIKRGNLIFGLKTHFEASQQGNMLLVKQTSNLSIQRSHENDIDFRLL